jgi:hypothetical protein
MALLLQIRTIHSWVGLLIAPTVLFMACTGILQIYNLHEAHGDYTPPTILVEFGSLHKDQVFRAEKHEAPSSASAEGAKPAQASPKNDDADDHPHGPKLATLALKVFLAVVALSLIGSTCAGIWMAMQQRGRRGLYLTLLVIGTLIPAVLAALSA